MSKKLTGEPEVNVRVAEVNNFIKRFEYDKIFKELKEIKEEARKMNKEIVKSNEYSRRCR